MAEQNQFGLRQGDNPGGLRCEEWDLLLTDALDGHLPAADEAAFHAHAARCSACADLLNHARQGREWLGYLHAEPEIPADLVARILDKTVGASAVPAPLVAGSTQGTAPAAAAIPWRRNFHEMRLLMTVAMAFFSIALTLNLAGVKLTSLSVANLRPSSIGGAISRQFYGAQGSLVRFYDNLRFVYQMESRMRELRRDVDTTPSPRRQQKTTMPAPSSNKDGNLAPGPAWGVVQRAGDRTGKPRAAIQDDSAKLRTGLARATQEAVQEAVNLNSWGQTTAGPRRAAELAGYDGRSLA